MRTRGPAGKESSGSFGSAAARKDQRKYWKKEKEVLFAGYFPGNNVSDFPQMSSKKQHFFCYRFWIIIRKITAIISTESHGNGFLGFRRRQKDKNFGKISKTYVWLNMEFFRKTIARKIVKIEKTSAESRMYQNLQDPDA
ncbi:predicted protein [Methanosarcina acetivorans C2A]|uniref:Uncharacterized protein n=1 Tax=Methanosarcina acetivorans (strain ATCC 35395 / DSM 2834 / JCM 12185 / C2A) TaxID=188937 RepID=Q8TNX0_METAC|nr:predicted protein [Methanosarcina acetivorans C2A]